MEVVYAQEDAPLHFTKSVFLVGPTPRSSDVESWRPAMIAALEAEGFDGVIFCPEPRDADWKNSYDDQVTWEFAHLELADLILAWIPRKIPDMPAFTTNVEIGEWLRSGKMLYGRPDWAEKCRYLDHKYRAHGHEPYDNISSLAKAAVEQLGEGAFRRDGERHIPLHIWQTEAFQAWYNSQQAAGNRLDDANVLWTFWIGKQKTLFAFTLWVKVWVGSEQRHKENECIISRSDIVCVLAFHLHEQFLESRVVLVKEFRSAVRNAQSMVYELPGGSSVKPNQDPLKVAADELWEETGISIEPARFIQVQTRQMLSTFATHTATLFAVELSDKEIAHAEALSQKIAYFGNAQETEKTQVVVVTLKEAMSTGLLDWSMIGMLVSGLQQYASQSRSALGGQ